MIGISVVSPKPRSIVLQSQMWSSDQKIDSVPKARFGQIIGRSIVSPKPRSIVSPKPDVVK